MTGNGEPASAELSRRMDVVVLAVGRRVRFKRQEKEGMLRAGAERSRRLRGSVPAESLRKGTALAIGCVEFGDGHDGHRSADLGVAGDENRPNRGGGGAWRVLQGVGGGMWWPAKASRAASNWMRRGMGMGAEGEGNFFYSVDGWPNIFKCRGGRGG